VSWAEGALLDGRQTARIELVRGQLASTAGQVAEAARLLLDAAGRLGPHDQELARQTLVAAWGAAFVGAAGLLPEIRLVARRLPPRPGPPPPIDLLLTGLAELSTDGHAAATPWLQQAAAALIDIQTMSCCATSGRSPICRSTCPHWVSPTRGWATTRERPPTSPRPTAWPRRREVVSRRGRR
jgi:hypothetical protein